MADQSGRGKIVVEADLEILETVSIPESISPRSNPSRWRPGQPVYIRARNTANTAWIDTWFSRLIIVDEPQEPVPSRQGRRISIPLGCKLLWADSFQFDDDASGVSFGTSENCSVIGSRLLQASEIAAGSISLNTWPYTINYPFGKDTTSFAELAGELAWSNDGRILYQNVAGAVTDKQLSFTSGSAIATVTIGTDDIVWAPLQNPDRPPETTKCAAIGYDLTTLPNPDITITTGDDSEQRVVISFVVGDENTQSTIQTTTTLKERESKIFQDAGLVDRIVTSETRTVTERYEPNANPLEAKLLEIEEEIEVKEKRFVPSAPSSNDKTLQLTTTSYAYDAEDTVASIGIVEEVAEGTLDADSDDYFNQREIRDRTTVWERVADGIYKTTIQLDEALIAQDSTVDKTEVDIWSTKRTITRGTASPRNNPPATKTFKAGIFSSEKHYEGTAAYIHRGGPTGRNRERLYTLKFGFPDPWGNTMAALHRGLLVGRYLGDEIELAINDALLTTPPLPEIRVNDRGLDYRYLGDSLAMEFTRNRATAHCAGIWIAGDGYTQVPVLVGAITLPGITFSGVIKPTTTLTGAITLPGVVFSGTLSSSSLEWDTLTDSQWDGLTDSEWDGL